MEKIGLVNLRCEPNVEIEVDSKVLANAFQYPYSIYTYNTPKKKELPKRYIINKGATILFWSDDKSDKTIVKRSKSDRYDKRLGFLTAYFQYHSGLSKNKANKYLDSLEEE